MRRWTRLLLLQCCAVVAAVALPATAQPPISFSADRLLDHVRVLAGEPLQGRQAGTPFERRAADYLARQLDSWQIAPLPTGERLQTFPLVAGPMATEQPPPTSLNVLGYIAPIVRQEDEGLIVLGAHLDHLGQTGDGGYFPGADDNASGVALVLEVARELRRHRRELRRGVVIVFFGAEECGLVGSRWFVQHGPIKATDIVAMVNVDMIGRPLVDQQQLALAKKLLRIDSLNSIGVVGTKGRPAFVQLVNSTCQRPSWSPMARKRSWRRSLRTWPATAPITRALNRSVSPPCSLDPASRMTITNPATRSTS